MVWYQLIRFGARQVKTDKQHQGIRELAETQLRGHAPGPQSQSPETRASACQALSCDSDGGRRAGGAFSLGKGLLPPLVEEPGLWPQKPATNALAGGTHFCWGPRAPGSRQKSRATNPTFNPRSFLLRNPNDEFEQFPMDEEGEGNESTWTETRNISFNRSSPLQRPPPVFISDAAAGYLTSPWLTRLVPSIYTGVVLISLPLNLLAVAVFVLKMKVKKPAVVYMLHLATADVLFVSVLPFKISYYFAGSDWKFGSGMCRFTTAAFYCNMYASVMLMTAISVDRFLAVVYPIQALSWRTLGRACFTSLAIWAMAIAGVLPLLLREQTARVPGLNITTCHDVLNATLLQGFYAYYFSAFSAIFFFVPLIISSVCYVSIIRCLSSSTVASQSNKSRAVLLSTAVFCIFLICFGPTNVLLITHYLFLSHSAATEAAYFAYLLCVCISSVSCCIDPLIYYYASSECQRHLYSILCCKENVDPNSYNSSGQLMASKMDTSSANMNNSIYKKLLA
ncbi:PREDICTED: proteinase-activated receptor 1 [Chinchilla lanigera]|uniref:proteinase-activated receptor 1 n=1 Tax=Chinchilla lanigera TaxID=34839 RepID=UPI0006967FDF|nr:PREDICTED: proteinase-activated receptor 1 [Chinchilla lanigera]